MLFAFLGVCMCFNFTKSWSTFSGVRWSTRNQQYVRVLIFGIDRANRLANERGQSQRGKKRNVCVLIPSLLVDKSKGLDGKVLNDFGSAEN